MRAAYIALAFLAATGCGAYNVTRSPVAPGAIAASATDRIRVMEATDGSLEGHVYGGSGRNLAARVVQALQGNFVDVALVSTSNLSEALGLSRADHARYLIVPTILGWEDRNSKWSMMPDRVSVQLALRDVATDTTVNAISYQAQSRRQFINGNPPPEALLNKNFDRAVRELLQR
ncbi:MAG TPA: DUF4823 domain-containing protein [Candidatus Binatia bacterium]|jgi:hypothetical protein